MSVAREAARRILSGNVKILDAMTVARALLAVPSPSPAPPSDIREALEYYATEYCEGWCSESDGIFPDCGGCKARAALTSSPPGDGKLREALEKAIKSANERMPGISVPASNGDNLAIALCTYFDDGEDPEDEETHWSKAAIEGQEQMVEAIRNHYAEAVRAALSIREAGEGK